MDDSLRSTAEVLADAITLDNRTAVERLLKEGIDPNKLVVRFKERSVPLLTYSILEQRWDTTRCLLDHGAMPDPGMNGGQSGASLLFWAIQQKAPVDLVEAILKRSPKETVHQPYGLTPLHMAAQQGSLDTVRLLVENGARIEDKDEFKATPLHTAAIHGHEDIAFYLIEKGANIWNRDTRGSDILMAAAESGAIQLAKYMLDRGSRINRKNDYGATPLSRAASRKDNRPMLEFLTAKGADINSTNFSNQSIVETTLRYKNEDSFLFLAEKGAALRINSSSDETPLHIATGNGLARAVAFLCDPKHGLSIDARNSSQKTPLHLSIENGHFGIADTLLDAGADINAQNKDGATPLMLAATKPHGREILERLIRRGAKLDLCDNFGRTALAVAVQCENWLNAETLLKHGGDIQDVLKGQKPAIFDEKVLDKSIMIRLMLDHGLEPDILGKSALGVKGRRTFEEWTGRTRISKWDSPFIQSLKKGNLAEILSSHWTEEKKKLELGIFSTVTDCFGNNAFEIIGARGEISVLLAPKYWKNDLAGAQGICDKLPPVYRPQGEEAMKALRTASSLSKLDRILKARRSHPRP